MQIARSSSGRQFKAVPIIGIWQFNPQPSAPVDRCSVDFWECCRAVIADC
jgi:hypothetical protein